MSGQEKLGSLVDPGAAAAPAKPGRFTPVSGKQGGAGMTSRDRMMAATAVVILLASGALLARHFGAFDSPPKALPPAPVNPTNEAPVTTEEKKAIDEQKQEIEEMIKEGEAERSGAG